jgi:transglutaminase-like putative cysteine protease
LKEYLPLTTLLRLLAVLVLALSPHVVRLPLWESAVIAALIAWRGLAAYKQWRMPPTWVKLIATLLAFGAVMASFGRISGLNGGTGLLCAMAALKLLEFRTRRDVMVMVFLLYFMLVTHFLFSQEIWTVVYLLGCVTAITALLIEVQHLGALAPRQTLRKSGTMVLQALPLMVLMFVLFPRIPGPLWGLPSDAGAGRSGLSEKMSPGDIASLIKSDEVAFRVTFVGRVPPPAARYWRGPPFDHFDGHTWEEGYAQLRADEPPVLEPLGNAVRYEITLEPHRSRWLFALDMPDASSVPPDAFVAREGHLLANQAVTERRRYDLQSYTNYLLVPALTERNRTRYLRLPRGFNPRTIELADQLRSKSMDDADIVQSVLQMFRKQNFVYTLDPPPLGRDSVDDFLFETRRGFCEHYASAFTVLMRAANIPARVVTGYQGGQRNEIGDYYVVRQSDAHAWSEVWLESHGWVRIDPTAAIAPQRIEQNLEAALGIAEGLPGYLSARGRLRFYFEARWDWLNAKWNGLVLAYGPELQQEFLSRFGLGELRQMILALTIGGTGLLALFGLFTLRQFAPARVDDPALQQWQRMTRQLAKLGYVQRPDEGPLDYAQHVGALRPEWAEAVAQVARLYVRSRYLHAPDSARQDELTRAVRAFSRRARRS